MPDAVLVPVGLIVGEAVVVDNLVEIVTVVGYCCDSRGCFDGDCGGDCVVDGATGYPVSDYKLGANCLLGYTIRDTLYPLIVISKIEKKNRNEK